MHAILLGILRIVIGGVLCEFAIEDGVWPADQVSGGWKANATLRLQLAYQDVIQWTHDKKISCSQAVFTIRRLSMESLGSSACFKSKAGKTTSIGFWLAERAAARSDANPNNVHIACVAGKLHGYSELLSVCQQEVSFNR